MNDLKRLQTSLGYTFSDQALLTLALTHRSVGKSNNERLEFLGDSIVNHIVAEALYQQFPKAREGEMSRMRASLVKGETLALIATELDVGQYLILGSGERKSGGHRRASILADTLEALAGAILLDSSFNTCRDTLRPWFASRLAALDLNKPGKDAKTQLQEFLQGRGVALPSYALLSVTGEDHAQEFHVSCKVKKPHFSVEAAGASRQKAEQAAAALALHKLGGK